MRSLASRMVLVTFASFFLFMWYAHRSQSIVAAQAHTPVTATRLYTGSDGLSHFEQVSMKFFPVAGAPASVEHSESVKAGSSYVVRLAPGYLHGWGNADNRRYVIAISGKAEVEVSGGEKMLIEPGRLILAEDLTGKGHTFRVVGTEDWVALFVDLGE